MLCISMFFLIVEVFSQKTTPTSGRCPQIRQQNPLYLERLNGEWYVWAHANDFWDETQRCVKSNWITDSSVDIPHVVYTANLTLFNEIAVIAAETNINEDNSITLTYHMPILGTQSQIRHVIGGDFVNYVVMWSCDEKVSGPLINTWVLTRESIPRWKVWPNVENAFRRYNLSYPLLNRIDNKDC